MSDTPRAGTPRRSDDLAALLRRLRGEAGMSGPQAARAAPGVSQSMISRYERGQTVPGVEQAESLARAYRASPEDARAVLGMVRDLRASTELSVSVPMWRGPASTVQRRIEDVEDKSQRIRAFQPLLVAGLAQTEPYMRAVFASGGDIDAAEQAAAVGARLDRQMILTSGGREVTVVMPEGALRWRLGGPSVMRAQLDRLVVVSRLPHVRVGVIPGDRTVDVVAVHGFDLFDERAVTVGTETGTAFLTSPGDVAAYVRLWADLEALAVFGDDARAVVGRVASELPG